MPELLRLCPQIHAAIAHCVDAEACGRLATQAEWQLARAERAQVLTLGLPAYHRPMPC